MPARYFLLTYKLVDGRLRSLRCVQVLVLFLFFGRDTEDVARCNNQPRLTEGVGVEWGKVLALAGVMTLAILFCFFSS